MMLSLHSSSACCGAVAARYFRAGADKVSIGSDAVYAAEQYLATGQKTGLSSVEQIFK